MSTKEETFSYRVWPDSSWEFEDDYTDRAETYDDFTTVELTASETDFAAQGEDILHNMLMSKAGFTDTTKVTEPELIVIGSGVAIPHITPVAVMYVEDWETPPRTALVEMTKEELEFFSYVNGRPRSCFSLDDDKATKAYVEIDNNFTKPRPAQMVFNKGQYGSWLDKEVDLNDRHRYGVVMVFIWPT